MAKSILPQHNVVALATRNSDQRHASDVTRYLPEPSGEDEALWGYVGIRVPGAAKSTWYPLTLQQTERLVAQIGKARSPGASPWVMATTRNNRALMVNAHAVVRIAIHDDTADAPEDWGLGWDGDGFPADVYSGLWAHYLGDLQGATSAIKARVASIVEQHGLDDAAMHERLRLSRVHYRDGSAESLAIDADVSWDTYSAAECGAQPALVDLSARDRGLDVFVPRDQLALVDMPLRLMTDAAEDRLQQIEAEAAIVDVSPHQRRRARLKAEAQARGA